MCCLQKSSSSVDNDVMDTSTDSGAGGAAAAAEAVPRGENVIEIFCHITKLSITNSDSTMIATW